MDGSTSEEKFERTFGRISSHMGLIGFNIFNPNWRPSLRSVVVFLIICIQPIATVTTVLQLYHDFEAVIECLCVSCTGMQFFFRSYFYLFQGDTCRRIAKDIREQCVLYGGAANPKINRLFHQAADRMILFYRVMYPVYLSSTFFILLAVAQPNPHKFGLPLPFFFPLVPPDRSAVNWYFNFVYQCVLIQSAIHHLVAMDGVLMMALLSTSTRITALQVMLDELDERIGQSEWARTDHLEADMDRIIELHDVTKRFARRTFEAFEFHCFFMFATACLVVCMCLNVIVVSPNNSEYPLLSAAALQLFVACYFGSTLLIANDRLPDSVYGIRWYRLNIAQQKKIMFLLANAQPDMLMSAIFMPVNMTSFVTILRAGYSYFAILN
uniref:Uncharacterized protein n=1 Tax=Anopheles dirus TaxID=7168 RepID=A0A182N6J5_9DIPT